FALVLVPGSSPASLSRSFRMLFSRTRKAFSFGALSAGLALAGALGLTPTAYAYPDKAIEMVISFPPAGATDTLARAVAQGLSQKLGQNVVVQNRPGAGGA